MEITCSQMDVLISFYLDGDLSNALKNKVEAHLKNCQTCRTKYDIIKSMVSDMKNSYSNMDKEVYSNSKTTHQYRIFQNNLSAYVDNELPTEENIKIKKFTINNKKARKDLEDTYNIRRLMNDSFNKTKNEAKQDFSRNVIKHLEPIDEYKTINPIIKVGIAFVLTVLVLSIIVIFSLSL